MPAVNPPTDSKRIDFGRAQLREEAIGMLPVLPDALLSGVQPIKGQHQKPIYVVYKQSRGDESGADLGWTGKIVVFDIAILKAQGHGHEHCTSYRSADPMPSETLERARQLALKTGRGKRIRVYPNGQLEVVLGTNPMEDL